MAKVIFSCSLFLVSLFLAMPWKFEARETYGTTKKNQTLQADSNKQRNDTKISSPRKVV